MLLGGEVLGGTVLGAAEDDYSSLGPFSELLKDPLAEREYLVEIVSYDPDAPGETTTRVGPGGRRGSFGATFFGPAILSDLSFERRLYRDDLGPSESGSLSFGDIKIANPPDPVSGVGPFDDLAARFPDGRVVVVKMGRPGFSLDEYGEVFRGIAEDWEWTDRDFRIVLRDPGALLASSALPNAYGGTGGLDGGEDLKDRPIPRLYGPGRQLDPIVVDVPNQVLQVSDVLTSVENVFDGLAPFSFDSDVADVYAWAPVPGYYVTDLANKVVRLGNKPQFPVTIDATGAVPGGALGDLVESILTRDGVYAASSLSLASFATMNALYPGPLYLYLRSGAPTLRTVLEELLSPLLASIDFTPDGLVALATLRDGPTTATIGPNDLAAPPKRVRTRAPYWQHRIGYARSHVVFTSENQYAAGASDELKAFAGEPVRWETAQDATIQSTRRLSAGVREVETALSLKAHAQAEAARSLALLGADRDQYDLDLKNFQYLLKPGQRVRFVYPRWGLAGGRAFWVLRVAESARQKRTKVRLW